MAAIRPRCSSATRRASTTCRARHTACRSRGWRRRKPRWARRSRPNDSDRMTLAALRDGGKRALAAALAGLERDPEGEKARALLDAAWREPRAHVVGVTGPPGVGKSSLCA